MRRWRMGQTMPKTIAARNPNDTIAASMFRLAFSSIDTSLTV